MIVTNPPWTRGVVVASHARVPRSPQNVEIYVSPIDGDDSTKTSITVRPWLDTVKDLQAKVFVSDTPKQRQQLFLVGGGGERLQDDGVVLALHGVMAKSTIQLVSA